MAIGGCKKVGPGLLLVALAGALAVGAAAQQGAPAKMTSPAEGLLASWNDIGRKLIAMAEDFPEDKYDFRPEPGVRTFAEQMLHAAGSVYYYEAQIRGQKPAKGPKAEQYKTRAALVAYVKKAVADGAALLRQAGDAGFSQPMQVGERKETVNPYNFWADFVEHAGEHYGQMVVYYRVNHLVPPESRPRK